MAGTLSALLRPILPPISPTPGDRRVVVLMWAAGVAQGYAAAHAVNTLPFARLTLGLTEGQMSGILSVTRIGALMALGFSVWGDARGRRVPYLVSFGILVAAAAATGLSSTPTTYVLAQVLVRLGATAAGILGAVILIETVSVGLRAYALSLYAGAASLGAGLATIAVALADLGPESWRWVFGSSLFGAALLAPLVRHLHPKIHQPGPPGDWWRRLGPTQRRSFAWVSGASFAIAAFTSVAVSFVFERLVDDLGLTGSQAALVALLGGTLGGLGFLLGGRLAETWGRRNTSLLALSLAVAGSLGLYNLDTVPLVTVSIFISSLGSFMLAPALGALRNELFPSAVRSRAVAWINNVAVMGSVTGLSIGQLTIDEIGVSATITRLAFVTIVAFALLPLIPETRGQDS